MLNSRFSISEILSEAVVNSLSIGDVMVTKWSQTFLGNPESHKSLLLLRRDEQNLKRLQNSERVSSTVNYINKSILKHKIFCRIFGLREII